MSDLSWLGNPRAAKSVRIVFDREVVYDIELKTDEEKDRAKERADACRFNYDPVLQKDSSHEAHGEVVPDEESHLSFEVA